MKKKNILASEEVEGKCQNQGSPASQDLSGRPWSRPLPPAPDPWVLDSFPLKIRNISVAVPSGYKLIFRIRKPVRRTKRHQKVIKTLVQEGLLLFV